MFGFPAFSPEEELQEVTGFPGREDIGARTAIGDPARFHPGQLIHS